ncbi:MAG: hypothetical protein JRI80_04815 [Deltaproteobacteria bacterium]|nr:hypothetical protein [Deltaproteobacteria bacterium]
MSEEPEKLELGLKAGQCQRPWWDTDWSEELTILALVALGICSLIWLGIKAETIISTIVGGFLGYLIRNAKKPEAS